MKNLKTFQFKLGQIISKNSFLQTIFSKTNLEKVNKVNKFNKIRKLWELFLRNYWPLMPDIYILKRKLGTKLSFHPTLGFSKCLLSSLATKTYVVRNLVIQLGYKTFDTKYQVPFYLWWIKPLRKLYKVPEYYKEKSRWSLFLNLSGGRQDSI